MTIRLPLFLGFVLLTPLATMAADTFENGDFGDYVVFPDSEGNHVEVHHGGIIFAEGKYWWYGQTFRDVPKGNRVWPATKIGVEMYSSEDLVRWKYEGVVLPCQPTGELEGPMRFERVKILYNERTRRYVMWFTTSKTIRRTTTSCESAGQKRELPVAKRSTARTSGTAFTGRSGRE